MPPGSTILMFFHLSNSLRLVCIKCISVENKYENLWNYIIQYQTFINNDDRMHMKQ